jgi:hypothetical protein
MWEGPQRRDLVRDILEVCILVIDSSAPASSPATLAGQSLTLHNRLPTRLPLARVQPRYSAASHLSPNRPQVGKDRIEK